MKLVFKWYVIGFIGMATLFATRSLIAAVWLSSSAEDWVEVPARLESAKIATSYRKFGTTEYLSCKYSYEYNGMRFTGKRLALTPEREKTEEWQMTWAPILITAYEQHLPIKCYVDPDAPVECVLDRTVTFGDTVPAIGFLIFAALYFTAFAVVRKRGLLRD